MNARTSNFANPKLPLIGRSADAQPGDAGDHWRSVFSGVWGPLNVRPVTDGNISGSLYSRKVGDLTFNRIEFGNQQFEKSHSRHSNEEPFFSLSFPESGAALCQIGERIEQLLPQNAYLLNNGMSAKLRVQKDYSTFNLKIPVSALEHRLGPNSGILSRAVVRPDAIFHMMKRLIFELLDTGDEADERTIGFMTNQMLETVAFFLTSGDSMSDDSIAVQAAQARVLAFIDAGFRDPGLTPLRIAEACRISRSYLYKIFADGPSVMERVRLRRLESARGMIMHGGGRRSMTEIAMASGFSSSSEFSRLFRKQYGVAPSRL
ncbi:AraC family transcriptional regulator [Paracoccus sediminicola]|uniref:AraC family transcriptional regulator n=1 Tax=Paracoccus sediminicola TaxID=3017783 RepID=UPI0022F07061|nr:helix-turn-helix domain-containing protein [Paracoccus sediminicola]WBU57395.1 helix-turn-helix domain-containing protein [Paracoccus sediminicola]